MTNLTSTRAAHWQPTRAGDDVVAGRDDVGQAICIILETPKGSDPHRPRFGSDLWRYIDLPIDRAIPHVVRETVDAIRLWEPRCELVSVTPYIDVSHLTLRVVWRLADGVETETRVRL